MAEAKKPTYTGFLKEEKVVLKFIKRETNGIKDPRHVAYGGLFVNTEISIPAPTLDNKKMKNLLTDQEKKGLESILNGVDLSIYGDFWKEGGVAYKIGILPLYLGKNELVLDKSDPYDYIKWKILLASPIVANSLNDVRKSASYRFVLTSSAEEIEQAKDTVGYKVLAYELYVEHKKNKSVLRYILRNLGKYTSKNQKLDFLQIETSREIEKDPSMFTSVAGDKLLKEKVLLEECIESGIINKVEERYYTLDGDPISDGETPTIEVSALYLGNNIGQEMRLALEAKLKQTKG
jgi:hypothetical protein